MRRRNFLGLLGGALIVRPSRAIAQQTDRPRRIAVLMPFAANDPEGPRRIEAFTKGLNDVGWTDGHNIRFDCRWPGDNAEQMRAFAKELVNLHPDVIVSNGTQATVVSQQATRSIPIVFVSVSDPVGQGIVESFAHPGSNSTGFAIFEFSMAGKWLELLKEIAPNVKRVSLIFNPDMAASGALYFSSLATVAPSLSVEMIPNPVHELEGIERSMASLSREPSGGLIVAPDTFTVSHRHQIIELAASYRLPAIYTFSYFVKDGGLLSYGVDSVDLFRRAAEYVDRILKGVKPNDLPVQQPTKFELFVNIKAARSLGLMVPQSLLTRADEVIE